MSEVIAPVAPAVPFEDTKPWYKSKGTLGAIVATIAFAATLAGFDFGPDVQAEVVEKIVEVTGLVGAVTALAGRLVAAKRTV